MIPEAGDNYKARPNGPIIKQNGDIIIKNSEWFVTCINGNKISLSVCSNNNGLSFKITIAKIFFGQNFEKTSWTPMGRLYIERNHWYPDVNEGNLRIKGGS